MSVQPAPGVPAAEVRLVPLVAAHAEAYHALVQREQAHLTAHGDYLEEVKADVAEFRSQFSAARPGPPLCFGLWLGTEIVGRCDLVPVDPPRYGLGCWIAARYEGHGLAGAAVGALMAHARDGLGATDVYAGVSRGNTRSVALLVRQGFTRVARLDLQDRYHLAL